MKPFLADHLEMRFDIDGCEMTDYDLDGIMEKIENELMREPV